MVFYKPVYMGETVVHVYSFSIKQYIYIWKRVSNNKLQYALYRWFAAYEVQHHHLIIVIFTQATCIIIANGNITVHQAGGNVITLLPNYADIYLNDTGLEKI